MHIAGEAPAAVHEGNGNRSAAACAACGRDDFKSSAEGAFEMARPGPSHGEIDGVETESPAGRRFPGQARCGEP